MVIVDRLTKYTHFCALSHPFKASTVATTFMEIVQNLNGSPKIIVSDRDPIFTGHFWTGLFSCLGTQLAHSSSYHPQSDGQTESISLNGGNYRLEIPLGKMSLLYRSIQSYPSVADNTCLKGRGMLSPNVGSLPLNWGILY